MILNYIIWDVWRFFIISDYSVLFSPEVFMLHIEWEVHFKWLLIKS